jgi:U3 small nucleolar RNA-associated protein MPP10
MKNLAINWAYLFLLRSRFNLDAETDSPDEEVKTADVKDSTSDGRLPRLIEKLEKKALEEKPWQLKGEASAKTRPENSLLEEYLEFDVTTRPGNAKISNTVFSIGEISVY